jgi:YD repeat-containing protein
LSSFGAIFIAPYAGWPDNRVLELDGVRAAYDAFGNLIERIGVDGSKMELGCDGADRLVALWRREANGHIAEAHYTYDALGRRIRKEVTEPDGESCIRYGWEGDRQAAENIDGELIRTTIYEPESFVPLARIEMRPAGPGEDTDEEQLEAQAMLSQVKHTLLAGGLALPKELIEAQAQLPQPAIRIGWFHTDHLGTPLG